MEDKKSKNKNTIENNNNNTKDKKKKNKIFKKYSLCFPFHINVKIIKDQKKILELINKIQNLFSNKINTFYFGLNTSLNIIQKNNNNEKLLFIFYKENMETLYDLILFRTKYNDKINIYFIDEEIQKKFLEIFKLKKLLSFVLIKNNFNENIFNEIKINLESYNINKENNQELSNNRIQEIIIEKNNYLTKHSIIIIICYILKIRI